MHNHSKKVELGVMLRKEITKSHLNNRICQHCGVKTSTVTPSFYYVFNISLSCNINIGKFHRKSMVGGIFLTLIQESDESESTLLPMYRINNLQAVGSRCVLPTSWTSSYHCQTISAILETPPQPRSRVSLLCLPSTKGGREERPWERGWHLRFSGESAVSSCCRFAL